LSNATDKEIATEKERFNAMCFLLCADETRYGELLEELKKEVYKGKDEYPKTIVDSYELLI